MPIAMETGSNRTPIPVGLHQAVCYAVIDLGTQPPMEGSQFNTKPQRKVLVMWEFPEERITVERDGQQLDLPRALSQEYTLSLHEKAGLRKALESWRGRGFTQEELKGFDLKNVLGVNCMINVIHKDNGYEKITAITPLPKGMQRKQPENALCLYDIATGALPAGIPEWVQKKIDRAEERRTNGHADDGIGHEPPPPRDEHAPVDDPIPF